MKIPLSAVGLFSDRRLRAAWRLGTLFGGLALASSALAQLNVTTLAGVAGAQGLTDGTGTTARFANPVGIAVDSTGNMYVADASSHRIRKVTPLGVVTSIAGNGNVGSADGTGTAATFNSPQGITIDATAANLYVADTANHKIRRVVLATGAVTTLAGTGTAGAADNAAGLSASFFSPIGVAVDATNLYVADTSNSTIRVVSLAGGNAVTTFAGAAGLTGPTNGIGAAARFNRPQALSIGGGTLYVADTLNHAVRAILLSTAQVGTLAGSAAAESGTVDGIGQLARLNGPAGVAVSGGNVFIADTANHTLRQVVVSSGAVTTIAGAAGTPGSSDGVGAAARLFSPAGVGADAQGNLYIADTANQMIRRGAATVSGAPVFTGPFTATFPVGTFQSFTINATGSPVITAFTLAGGNYPPWAQQIVTNAGTNTATISGTPGNTVGSPFIFTVSATNGVATATQTFTINVTTGTTAPTITQHPQPVTLPIGVTTASFNVIATGTPATFTYQWERLKAGTGAYVPLTDNTSLDGAFYTGTTGATLSIQSITGNMNQDAFRVTVTNAPGSSTTSNPATLTVPTTITSAASTTFSVNQFNSFNFTASGTPPTTFTMVDGFLPSGVTFNNGLLSGFTSEFGNFSIGVIATNSGGTSARQSFTLTVTQPQAPTITSGTSTSMVVGQPGTFTFTAAGAPAPIITLAGAALPAGLVFNSPVLSGTPLSAEGSPIVFTVSASNSSGTSQQLFSLTIIGTPPLISLHPLSATANVGGTAVFTAAATGTPAPTVRWQRQPSGTSGFIELSESANFTGTTTGTLTVNNIAAFMSGDQFRMVATNNSSLTTPSQAATLTVNPGTTIATFAGLAPFAGGFDGIGNAARFNNPSGIASDTLGNIYVADTGNHTIRKITSTGVVTTIAGATGAAGSADGAALAARFNSPQGIAIDSAGNLYVADTFNHTIRVISTIGNVTTLAGTPTVPGAVDGVGSLARFLRPSGLVVDPSGTVYVADSGNHAIRRILPGGTVSTFAGTMGFSGAVDNLVGTLAQFNTPNGLARDSNGNLYVADTFNYVIRRVTPGGSVSLFAGAFNAPGLADGGSTVARFNRPYGVAVDATANILVADTFSHTLRKITPAGDVSTIAGSATQAGSADGSGSTARFDTPFAVLVDATGNIFVADSHNHTIRKTGSAIAPQIQTQPSNRAAVPGGSTTFTVTATGTPTPGYQWQRAPANFLGIFTNLSNDSTFSGVSTPSLTINNVTQEMNGDQYRVIVNNGIPNPVESSTATLSIGVAPVFTSPAVATFQALQAGSFTVTATSTPAATFSATGLPAGLSINSTTGQITGTVPDTTGSPFNAIITANNGVSVTQTLVITVTPAVLPPAISGQPVNVAVDQGQTGTLTVVATGTPPFTYQWRRDGFPINGATGATLQLGNIQNAAAGVYTVSITNSAGTVTSAGATITVNSIPVFTSQPRTQTALTGGTVTFSVSAVGGSSNAFTYQWRKNGVSIAGANNASLVLNGVAAGDAGNYDVQVGNPYGVLNSSLALLSVVNTPVAPTITAQPAARTVVVGGPVTFSLSATGAPSPSYQWRKGGVPIPGQNSATLTISAAQAADAGNYDVVVTNGAGSVTSALAGLTVASRSYAGVYFGAYGGGLGDFALYVREDNTGVFLSYLPGSVAPVMSTSIRVSDAGQFAFSQGAVTTSAIEGEPARAAALQPVNVNGTIAADGAVSGSVQGGASAQFTGTRVADAGASQGVVGFYQAGAAANGGTAYTITGPNGVAFMVVQSGASTDGGRGAVSNTGALNVTTNRSIITGSINGPAGTFTGSSAGAVVTAFSGASDVVLARQRLVNISSRARVATGDAVAIAGFVISGEESKTVLIRAVGPTIGAAPFNVAGALAAPRLELFRGTASLGVSTGIAANRGAIDAAGQLAGAFALAAAGTDSAILTTLAPGNYTAVVSSANNTAGVALVEVYDLSAATPGQKLLNIATRAAAGAGDNILIAGLVVPPGAPKRVLVRAVGPGLTPFGVTGVLAQPVLTLFSGSTTVAQNTNWNTSTDAALIASSSSQVGAFGLANNDSALVVTLAPGNYTAQVGGVGGATGVALIEVYELP